MFNIDEIREAWSNGQCKWIELRAAVFLFASKRWLGRFEVFQNSNKTMKKISPFILHWLPAA